MPKAEVNKKQKVKWEEITRTLNARNPTMPPRTVEQVQRRLKAMKISARKHPTAKRTNPTGGGPPAPPPENEFEKVMVDVVRDDPSTDGLACGFESGVSDEANEAAAIIDVANEDMPVAFEEVAGSSAEAFSNPRQQYDKLKRALESRDTPSCSKTPKKAGGSEIEKAQLELIELEKERVKLEISKVRTEIENADLKNALLRHKLRQVGYELQEVTD